MCSGVFVSVGVHVFHEDGIEKADDGVEHVGDVQGAVLEAVTNEDAAVPCTSHKGAFGV